MKNLKKYAAAAAVLAIVFASVSGCGGKSAYDPEPLEPLSGITEGAYSQYADEQSETSSKAPRKSKETTVAASASSKNKADKSDVKGTTAGKGETKQDAAENAKDNAGDKTTAMGGAAFASDNSGFSLKDPTLPEGNDVKYPDNTKPSKSDDKTASTGEKKTTASSGSSASSSGKGTTASSSKPTEGTTKGTTPTSSDKLEALGARFTYLTNADFKTRYADEKKLGKFSMSESDKKSYLKDRSKWKEYTIAVEFSNDTGKDITVCGMSVPGSVGDGVYLNPRGDGDVGLSAKNTGKTTMRFDVISSADNDEQAVVEAIRKASPKLSYVYGMENNGKGYKYVSIK
ncbi:MAG: hypothetical protein K6F09_08875 [Clostridiales bacterium]|nr:hypothetical protein [Clostridiales bacterium]